MKKIYKKYDITQCSLYKCNSSKRVRNLLRLDENEYKNIVNIVRYNEFQTYKKDRSAKRIITAPKKRTKEIQSRLLKLIEKIDRPSWLISGQKGKCYIDNAKIHILSNFFLTVDIRNFYDNCQREYVYRFFKHRLKMSGDIAGKCTDIVTYNKKIPTGCPTSQLIAFYAYENMFNEIYKIADRHGCKFTLYVDDMTFSSKNTFNVNKLKREIDIILRKYGHKPNYGKIRYYSHGKSVLITGVIIIPNHEMRVPNKFQKKIYDEFQKIKKLQNKRLVGEEKKEVNSLKGRIQAAQILIVVNF